MTASSENKALLLDLDGTVVDTHELIFQSYDHAMRTHCGCEGSRQILQQCTGLHLHDIFAATLDHFGVPVSDQLLTESIAIYRAHLCANEAAVSTFPGMRDTLFELVRRGWRLGIVTTKPREAAHRHLQSQLLTDLFEAVITGDQCANLKPHPEPFLKGVEALGVDSRTAIGVGDSEHDIRSARAAGLVTVAACWGTLSREKLLDAGPDIVVERPIELLALS